MVKDDVIAQIIFPAIEEFLVGGRKLASRETSTVIFGAGGILESIEFVGFIVSVESAIVERTGKNIRLVDPKALSRRTSPFRTVESLADYVTSRLEEIDV